VRLGDLAVLVDDVRDALGVFVLRRAGGAVGDADLAVGVAEEGERELVLRREVGVVVDRVEADADDLRVLFLVLVGKVPEPGTLGRSASGIGLGIEPEHELLPAEVAQLHLLPRVIDCLEIGSGITHIQHRCTSEQVVRNIA
jgi:hypothetical protein